MKKITLALFLFSCFAHGAPKETEFRADHYQRDLHTNTVVGRGNVWFRKGAREVEADEMEVDFSLNRALARGNVRIREGSLRAWSSRAEYYLDGREATFDDATLISGQLILTGRVIRRTGADNFRIDEGSYSNCVLTSDPSELNQCGLDWKLYGRLLDVTIEGYAHIYDAIVYAKGLPVMYTPYFVVPVKSKRQSGFLLPFLNSHSLLGSGFSLPYYQVLGPWHDLTLTFSYWNQGARNLNTAYRYLYSPLTQGDLTFDFSSQRIETPKPPAPAGTEDPAANSPALGFLGEWGLKLNNFYFFNDRIHTRQTLRLISTPYYIPYYGGFGSEADLASLRSQVSLTVPTERQLFTVKAQYHQSLSVMANPKGIDKDGAPILLPSIGYSLVSIPFLNQLLSFELDATFNNYYRPTPFDQVPAQEGAINDESPEAFDQSDYLRTGRRTHLEPRLVASFPMPAGMQLQPLLRAGALFYSFDWNEASQPQPYFVTRQYLETQLPFTFYLSRRFSTDFEGFEKIAHVLQPRVIYVHTLYTSEEPRHPFFSAVGENLSSPQFDIIDQLIKLQYMRFEFINRFLRKTGESRERFLLLQIAEQYNFQTYDKDLRTKRQTGPLEILGELRLGPVAFQAEARVALEVEANGVRESDLSGGVALAGSGKEFIRVNSRFTTRADPNQSDSRMDLSFFKTLTNPFDFGGKVEWSFKNRSIVSYEASLFLQNRPKSCWSVGLTALENAGRKEIKLSFALDFGSPSGLLPL